MRLLGFLVRHKVVQLRYHDIDFLTFLVIFIHSLPLPGGSTASVRGHRHSTLVLSRAFVF